MHSLLRLQKILIRIEEYIAAWLLIAMTAVVFWGILERFVIKAGFGFTDELSRYISIWAVFFGGCLGVVKNAHIGVEVFVKPLPQRVQRPLAVLANGLCMIFMGLTAWYGWEYFLRLGKTSQTSPAMEIPMYLVFMAVPIGCALMCLHYLVLSAVIATGGGMENSPENPV
ncbi:MAG: TRAP transporter small permease [Deltaproteobacteria bacterium]|nr:TRAP transporter small permease [Deltaproteobacteria bacterium]